MEQPKLQSVRGTKDLYGSDILIFNYIVEKARKISLLYGFKELSTPIIEFSEIYERNLGEASDIIAKEVYKFPDRGGNFLTLRPEFTAGIVRAIISNGELQQNLPQKLFSYGPLFRYDRPQKGRQRQFHQINFELIGSNHPLSDVETIGLACHILEELGIKKANLALQINSLGCNITRLNYQEALVEYFSSYYDELSEDSKARLQKNPMRILDSKDPSDQKIAAQAPLISKFYQQEARNNYEQVLQALEDLEIKYYSNPQLVRGLDYYTGVVFEFITENLGAQNTVLAGGRYDQLIEKMGGKNTPAIGFAAGIERLMLLLKEQHEEMFLDANRAVSIIYISEAEHKFALSLANSLRRAGINTEIYHGSMKKQIKRASQINSKWVIMLGEEELKSGELKIKDFDSGTEQNIKQKHLMDFLLKSL